MAAQQTPASQVISETAKQEGGPHKGSSSAQMQSEVGKQQNFEQAAQHIGGKMETDPSSVTSEDANYLKSREARLTGQAQPPAGSISSDAQSLAAENEGATRGTKNADGAGGSNPAAQSAQDRQHNFEQTASEVGSKMQNAPGSVTQEDAATLHSREAKLTGQANPPQGSLSSQAEHLAAVNEGRASGSSASTLTGTLSSSENTDPSTQSAADRMSNFEQASAEVGDKMANNPVSVTKDDANLLHSREHKAFGETSKGGVASQAQSMAAENERQQGS